MLKGQRNAGISLRFITSLPNSAYAGWLSTFIMSAIFMVNSGFVNAETDPPALLASPTGTHMQLALDFDDQSVTLSALAQQRISANLRCKVLI